jgi:BlaI family penicillinase repressor
MSEELTRRERQISEVVFRLGEASATEIMQALPDQPANATVRTILTILEEKGVVVRRRDGKRYLYRPAHSKKSLAKSAFRKVVETFFGGSVEEALAAHLADPKTKLDKEQLKRLRDLIKEHESKER